MDKGDIVVVLFSLQWLLNGMEPEDENAECTELSTNTALLRLDERYEEIMQ